MTIKTCIQFRYNIQNFVLPEVRIKLRNCVCVERGGPAKEVTN